MAMTVSVEIDIPNMAPSTATLTLAGSEWRVIDHELTWTHPVTGVVRPIPIDIHYVNSPADWTVDNLLVALGNAELGVASYGPTQFNALLSDEGAGVETRTRIVRSNLPAVIELGQTGTDGVTTPNRLQGGVFVVTVLNMPIPVQSVKATLVDVPNVAPGIEIDLTETTPGTWTCDTTVEKTCHDCGLQYTVPFVAGYVPDFESYSADLCTVAMDAGTEYGGTFGPSSPDLVSTVMNGRTTRIQPPEGYGYLSGSTITFTCAGMPLEAGGSSGSMFTVYSIETSGHANGSCDDCATALNGTFLITSRPDPNEDVWVTDDFGLCAFNPTGCYWRVKLLATVWTVELTTLNHGVIAMWESAPGDPLPPSGLVLTLTYDVYEFCDLASDVTIYPPP